MFKFIQNLKATQATAELNALNQSLLAVTDQMLERAYSNFDRTTI